MTIKVRKWMIESGRGCNSRKCPLAVALQTATQRPWLIGDQMCWIDGDGEEATVQLPPNARDFVRQFDIGEEVMPFTFFLSAEAVMR